MTPFLSLAVPIMMSLAVSSGSAQPDRSADTLVDVRLISPTTMVSPGSQVDLGLVFKMTEGWHIYWNGLSDTGMPPNIELQLPEGYAAGEVRWPTPERHVSPGDLLDYVYEDEVVLVIPVDVPASAKPGDEARITADLVWLVCKEACIRERGDASITLRVAPDGAAPKPTPDAKLIEQTRRRVPKPLPPDGSGPTAKVSDNRLEISAPGASEVLFYPGPGSLPIADPIKSGHVHGETLRAELGEPLGEPQESSRVSGVVEVRYASDRPTAFYHIDLPAGG